MNAIDIAGIIIFCIFMLCAGVLDIWVHVSRNAVYKSDIKTDKKKRK